MTHYVIQHLPWPGEGQRVINSLVRKDLCTCAEARSGVTDWILNTVQNVGHTPARAAYDHLASLVNKYCVLFTFKLV